MFKIKPFVLICAFLFLSFSQAYGWGKNGHAIVAQVATNHLTPRAKTALDKYLRGESLVDVASYADKYRPIWTLDLGFTPINPNDARVTWLKGFDFSTPTHIAPISHSVTVNENFKSLCTNNINNRFYNNCAFHLEKFRKELRKTAEKMDEEMRFREICWIIHLIGDFHCPQHIIYLSKDTLKGSFKVTYRGEQVSYHAFWDRTVVGEMKERSDIIEFAQKIDCSSNKEFKEITKGNIYDWVARSAKDSWPAHRYQSGDTLPDTAIEDFQELVCWQLRNGGYRLAAYLNSIFK